MITDAGDTMNVFIDDEEPNIVKGGLLAGDRIALILNGQKMKNWAMWSLSR